MYIVVLRATVKAEFSGCQPALADHSRFESCLGPGEVWNKNCSHCQSLVVHMCMGSINKPRCQCIRSVPATASACKRPHMAKKTCHSGLHTTLSTLGWQDHTRIKHSMFSCVILGPCTVTKKSNPIKFCKRS